MIDNPPHSLGWGWKLTLLFPLVAIGAGFRLQNLTAWPTVFHPMLQYENAVTTRVLWLKMRESSLNADEAPWLQHWNGRFKAPPVIETLAGLALVWALGATRRLQQEPDEALAPVYRHAGTIVGPGQSVLSLSWHYGFPLTFHGWVVAHHWGYAMDRPLKQTYYESAAPDDGDRLTRMIQRFHPTHFVVTRLDEWEKQQGLRQALHSRFALCYKDDALIVYDLRRRPAGGARNR